LHDISEDFILLCELPNSMTSRALINHLRHISFVCTLGEIDIAFFAALLETVSALDNLVLDKHAERTLEVWRHLIQRV